MLMAKFYEKPASIIDFFELEHIQRKNNNKEEEEEIVPLNPDGTVMEIQSPSKSPQRGDF
jgi:hypothetical protein